MIPADLRALAEMVEDETSGAILEDVAMAIGWRLQPAPIHGSFWVSQLDEQLHNRLPSYFYDLNAIAAAWQPLRGRGWTILLSDDCADYKIDGFCRSPEMGEQGISTTLPRAWLALLLRCMAAEMEAAQ